MVRDLKTIPVDIKLVLQVAAEAAAPLAIVWIVGTPAERVVASLLKMSF